MTDSLPRVMLAIGLGVLVLGVGAIARRLPIPAPILQVLAGLLVGFVPGHPLPSLDPELVFLVFLPPVLWAAAYFTSLREFKANLRPIGLLAVGLVLVTTAAVAIFAHMAMPGLGWAAAVALGAIVSPPDAVAAEAILKRLPVPHRITVILEGESLVNDASALVLYRTAVAAAVTGQFSLGEATVRFFIDAFVGVMLGLLVGVVVIRVSKVTADNLAHILITLLAPYVAWVLAESVHASAVLACVAGGLYTRQHFSSAVPPISRLQARAVWELLVFVVNALIFVLLGAQFGELVAAVPRERLPGLVATGLGLSVLVIVVRLLWVPLATWLPRALSAERRRRDPMPSRKAMFLIGWTSMRGIVSLASALALPLVVAGGAPFPFRAELILLTMGVILVTLVAQGLSLGPVIRWFRFPHDARAEEEEMHARREAVRNALERLDDLRDEPWAREEDLEQLREEYRRRTRTHSELVGGSVAAVVARRRLRAEALRAERRSLIRLRNEGAISDEVLAELERELDVEALRIGEGGAR